MKAYRPWRTKELQKATALYRAGFSHADIGDRLGRSKVSVARALNYAGVKRYTLTQLSEREKQIRQLHQDGLSDYEIAAVIDVGRATIQRWRTQLGLPVNPISKKKHRKRYKEFLRRQEVSSLVQLRYVKKRIADLLAFERLNPS